MGRGGPKTDTRDDRPLAKQLLTEYRTQFFRHCIAMPHSRSLLHHLRAQGIHTFLITNGETPFQQKNAASIGVLPLLDVVLVSEQEGRKKPDPALFLKAAYRLQVPPETCLFFGDHPHNDIHGAAAVGMKTAWLQNHADWPNDLPPPDWTLQRLGDLFTIMRGYSSVSALHNP
ncbi:HAD family hydrolase [Desmospora activa]|uniref:HAD family hydrolase n=1 Tax=Desmospora activa TaxID=500615 RepID=UPI000D305802|nr:HAD family hydrolase [Desmospora activa]